jgi:hypothetical protein
MPTEIEIRLSEFVDREDEMRRFCAMLDFGKKPVMFISGDGGLGKSSLIARMIHECANRKLRKSEIVWTETQNHDYLGIMRKMRDDIGPQYFHAFTTVVNQLTDPNIRITLAAETGNIRVAEGMSAENVKIGDIAGLIVKDAMFVVAKGDNTIPESERMIPITRAFLENARNAAERLGPIIVFLDATDKMAQETRGWVMGELLGAVRAGKLPGVYVVYCGRERLILDRYLRAVAEQAELAPLCLSDVITYLEKRGIEESSRASFAEMLIAITSGNPLQIANSVDALMMRRQR